ncbi:MAG: bifunctional tRNA (5-methylaminomethyl-2-thiouridine)(34)-methyltransferase MnmD/FAD-dependent 5-carboxymethylaminomethyl-2-thiouridine(34) oxidoreductase MnmC [Pseudomonadota bacterium]
MDHGADKETGAVKRADLDWDETGDAPFAPRSVFFDDIYFAGDGLAEATHVFLDGNALRDRFEEAAHFTIGELGFGTGLNFLAAWRAWAQRPQKARGHLHFLSFEKYPLAEDELARAHRAWPDLASQAAALRRALPPPIRGFHRVAVADDVTLTLYYGDVREGLCAAEARSDAWFLDGFSPAKNPGMWAPDLFHEIARLSAPGATAATFTVAGDVRRALTAAGFTIEKRPGYGRKREMLTARLDRPLSKTHRKPWTPAGPFPAAKASAAVAIIGAGIAGASLAHALRREGFSPTVFEADAPAAGASGNRAGLIMPRLDLGETPAAQFFRQAYAHVVGLLRALDPEGAFYSSCGVTLRADDSAGAERLAKLAAAQPLPTRWMEQRGEALFFAQAGIVDPRAFVRTLLSETPIITKKVLSVARTGEAFSVETNRGAHNGFEAVIIANSVAALNLVQARTLPLSGVAGQLDYFPTAPAPNHAVAAGPYVAPAPGGGLIAGATYEKITGAPIAPTREATVENINAAQKLAPQETRNLSVDDATPRVSVRCQTPDRLPIAGPMPDWAFYSGAYDNLRFGRKQDYPVGEIQEGVYILTGLGSRGLVTAPLCAALIASALSGAPNPVNAEIAQALHPGRFFVRDLKRARPVTAEPIV